MKDPKEKNKSGGAPEKATPEITHPGSQLLAAGWERRSITDAKRVAELVELYESLGFEVHLQPVTPEILEAIGEECRSCYIDRWDEYKIIFTRENLKERQ